MLHLDYRDPRPIYEQIVDSITQLALRGVLQEGEQLLGVRQLAMELSVNPNTVQRAYGELEKRGIVYSVKGKGNFIAGGLAQQRAARLAEIEQQIRSLANEARTLGADEQTLAAYITQKEGENA